MDLATTNNQTFIWTVSLALWAPLIDLPSARYRMEIRPAVDRPDVCLSFDSEPSLARGTATYYPATKLLTMRAPLDAVRQLPVGRLVYGLVMSMPLPSPDDPFVKLLATGEIDINKAIPAL